jgi:hypothetical protein
VQDITENIPDQYQNGDPPGEDLEGLDGIDTIGVVAIISANNVSIRAFRTGFITSRFLTSGFFLTGFHE